jgi:hypothetical protein
MSRSSSRLRLKGSQLKKVGIHWVSTDTFTLGHMSADKLADVLCTSINDVNEMSADKMVSGRKTSPTCPLGVTTEQPGLLGNFPDMSGSDKP